MEASAARKSQGKKREGFDRKPGGERGRKNDRAVDFGVARRRWRSLAMIETWGRRKRSLEKVRESFRSGVRKLGEKGALLGFIEIGDDCN